MTLNVPWVCIHVLYMEKPKCFYTSGLKWNGPGHFLPHHLWRPLLSLDQMNLCTAVEHKG